MKTKYRIMQAMEDLLVDYSYEQITVSMIAKKSCIARQGFYKFYRSKEDLSYCMYLHFADRAAIMDGDFTLYDFIYHDLSEMNRHSMFFNKLAYQTYESDLFEILHNNVYKLYMKMLRYQLNADVDDDLAFLLDGYCRGCLFKFVNELKTSMPLDVAHMTSLCIAMMPQQVREILSKGKYPATLLNE